MCITQVLQTLRKQLHTVKLKQFINSVGNAQLCRVVHPSTSSPTRSLCAPLPDSSVSGTPVIPTTRDVSPSPLPTLWTHPRSVFSLQKSICLPCLPLSSLFLSLLCLPRQLVTHAVDMLHSARQQDRNEVGLLCWNTLVGVKYSARDNQRCLKLWLLSSDTRSSKCSQFIPFTFPAHSILLRILVPRAAPETWKWLHVTFKCHHAASSLRKTHKSLGRVKHSIHTPNKVMHLSIQCKYH